MALKHNAFMKCIILSSLTATASQAQEELQQSNPNIEVDVVEVLGQSFSRPVTFTEPGTSVIDLPQIEELQPQTLGELVDFMPGVSLDSGARPGAERINVWGFGNTEDLNVRVDGAPIGFEQYRYGSFFFEPELLKSAKIIRGAHDVRTGNGGFGGSFILTTKDADDFLRAGESIGAVIKTGYAGANEQWRHSGTAFAKSDNGWQILVNGVRRDAEDIRIGGGDRFKYSGFEQNSFLGKLKFESDDHEFQLTHTQYDDQGRKPWANRRGTMPDISNWNIKKYGGKEKAEFAYSVYNRYREYTSAVNYRYQPSNPLIDTRVTLSHSQNHRTWKRPPITIEKKMFVSVGSFGHESWLDYERLFAEVSNTAIMGDHTVTAGIQYRGEDRDSIVYNHSYRKNADKNYGYFTPYFQPSGQQETYAFFIEDEFQLTPALQVIPSLRYDYIRSEGEANLAPDYNDASVAHDFSKVTHSGWSPRLAINYELSKETALSLAYAYSLQAPSIDNIYSVQYARARKAVSTSRDLEVTRVHAYRLGLSDTRTSLFNLGDQLSTELTLFWNDVNNDVAQRRGDKSTEKLQGWFTNLEGFYTYGFDLEFQYRLQQFYANAGVSMVRGKHKGSLRDSTGEDEYLTDIPPLHANLALGYQWTESFSTGWRGAWFDAQNRVPYKDLALYTSNSPSDEYFLQNVYANWAPNEDFSVRLTISNLTDQNYVPYLSSNVPGTGRDVRISAQYQW